MILQCEIQNKMFYRDHTYKISLLSKLHAYFFYKNVHYKNIEADTCRKFKNILRMFRGSNSSQHRFVL